MWEWRSRQSRDGRRLMRAIGGRPVRPSGRDMHAHNLSVVGHARPLAVNCRGLSERRRWVRDEWTPHYIELGRYPSFMSLCLIELVHEGWPGDMAKVGWGNVSMLEDAILIDKFPSHFSKLRQLNLTFPSVWVDLRSIVEWLIYEEFTHKEGVWNL